MLQIHIVVEVDAHGIGDLGVIELIYVFHEILLMCKTKLADGRRMGHGGSSSAAEVFLMLLLPERRRRI